MFSFIYTTWLSIVESYQFKAIVSVLLTFFHTLFGLNYVIYEALFILILIDIITGIFSAIKQNKKITSMALKETIKKVTLYALFVSAAYQLQRITELLGWVEVFAVTFLAVTEMLSILENLSKAGIIIPKWAKKKLEKYMDTGEL